MQLKFWAATDVGRHRQHNEDNFLVDKKLNLFLVADGMGGHAAGEVASGAAVREVREVIKENRDILEQFAAKSPAVGRQDITALLEHAVQRACSLIFGMAQQNTKRRGMGTTLSMFLIAGDRGFIAHVGDSRIYLVRQSQVHQLTEDHSLHNELVRRGKLKKGEALAPPYKNAVTRAVGIYEHVQVDTLDFDILPGDVFLMCSDGLHMYLSDQDISEKLSDDDVRRVPERFIQHANERGGKDNITSVVIRTFADPAQPITSQANQNLDALRHVALFRSLHYKDLVTVMNITRPRSCEPGDVVIREKEGGEEMFIVVRGLLEVSKDGLVIANLEDGGHFGEMALVDPSPSTATVMAVEHSDLLVINQRDFSEVLHREPTLGVKILRNFVHLLASRLRLTSQELGLSSREASGPGPEEMGSYESDSTREIGSR